MNHKLLGVVLCGGRSSRMGRDKAVLAHPTGGTFADHAIGRLTGLCDHICLAGRSLARRSAGSTVSDPTAPAAGLQHNVDPTRRSKAHADAAEDTRSPSTHPSVLTEIDDPVPYRGPATGIASALAFAQDNNYDACLVTPVDMPMLQIEDLVKLRQTWIQQSNLCCAVVEGTRQVQPLVAIYPVSSHVSIRQLADSNDRSLSRWIEARAFTPVALSAEACRNVNTPEDLSGGPKISV